MISGREALVAVKIFGDAHAQDVEVELLNGFGKSEGRLLIAVDSERGNDFAEFFVLLQFDKAARFAGRHIGEVVVSEREHLLGESVVREVNGFGRGDLDIASCVNDFHDIKPP